MYTHRPNTPGRHTPQPQRASFHSHTPRPSTPYFSESVWGQNSPYPGSPWPNPQRARRPSWQGPPPQQAPVGWQTSSSYPTPPSRQAPGWQTPSSYQTPPSWQPSPAWQPPPPAWGTPQEDPWLTPAAAYTPGSNLNTRHSFSTPNPRPTFTPNEPYPFYVNPWINAETPRFYFDLSLPNFNPLLVYGRGQSELLPPEEMIQPATHPPTTQLRLISDALPKWPVELQLDPSFGPIYPIPPITLSDVLVSVHRSVHKQVSQKDLEELDETEEAAISLAFTRRCKATPEWFETEWAKGVKRVDFLAGKTKLAGLLRMGVSDGWEVMKLAVY